MHAVYRSQHVDWDNFDPLISQVITKHRPDEHVEIAWPPYVLHGIDNLGWVVRVREIEDADPQEFMPEPPNWLVVAEQLSNSLRSLMEEVLIPEADEDDPETTEFLALWQTAKNSLDAYHVAMTEASMVTHRHDFKAGDDPEDRCYVCGETRPEPPEDRAIEGGDGPPDDEDDDGLQPREVS